MNAHPEPNRTEAAIPNASSLAIERPNLVSLASYPKNPTAAITPAERRVNAT
eukprot:CAMPEP_0114252244 /NCGR_PEP_ID=MMETSP0058-20121206/15730_1 /TAXON_ID=36894 /ORGANISM="Pyramimonas parkeae, CCMP726" /LENGTH=51 /DNA_ID=CAMNT_0001366159 /DNA_START=263 /DNA_END=418 /DNA_ORIENTATION=+